MLFIWFMLAGFIFLLTPHKLTKTFQDTFDSVFSWPLGVGRSFMLSARTNQPLTDVVERREYTELENHLANMIGQRDQAYKEIERLSGLRKRFPFERAKLVRAGIYRGDGHSELRIDSGQEDGLAEGQFVLAGNSIIGSICDISSRTAHVKLLTDPTSIVAVNIAGLDKLVMQGSGDNSAKVEMVKRKIDVGEPVLVRERGGFLDGTMIAGRVARCERNEKSALLWDLTVKPVCDIEDVDSVTVIVMNP